jgi:hypothetical protein
MTRWKATTNTTPTTNKRKNYDVSYRLPVPFSAADRSVGAVRPCRSARYTRLRRLLAEAVGRWTLITFALVAVWLFLALSPSVTNQAQEGQSRDWMGEKLASRSYQTSARELGR